MPENDFAPRISVLIVSHNYALFLPQCLGSVQEQTFTDYETVLLDDGSTDGTAEIAARYGRVRYIRQERRGVAAARNAAIRAARGEYLAFLDADDFWPPDRLRLLYAFAASAPSPKSLFSARWTIFSAARRREKYRWRRLWPSVRKALYPP